MNDRDSTPYPQVVAGGNRQLPWKWLIVAVVVVALAGAGYWAVHRSHPAAKRQQPAKTYLQQQHQSALDIAKGELSKAKTKEEKVKAYGDLGVAYANLGDYDNEIQAYLNLKKVDPNAKEQYLGGLGDAYEYKGDKQKAIAAYTELLDYYKSRAATDPYAASNIEGLQNQIKHLHETN